MSGHLSSRLGIGMVRQPWGSVGRGRTEPDDSPKIRVDNRHVHREKCGCIWDVGEKAVLCDWHKHELKLRKRREQYAKRKEKK